MTTSSERVGEEASFGPELFAFLADLGAHNDREWFAANKERYEAHVLEPALAFVEDFGYRLPEISAHFEADPRRSGGSLFRIHRDTRFSKDKSPYKTNTGMYFRHKRAKDVHAPGYYLHLAPGEVFAGGGIWRPATPALTAIRDAIVRDPEGWDRARQLGDGLRARRRHAQAGAARIRQGPPARGRPQAQGLLRPRQAERGGRDGAGVPRPLHARVRVRRTPHALPLPGARDRVLSVTICSAGARKCVRGAHAAPLRRLYEFVYDRGPCPSSCPAPTAGSAR